MAKVDITLQDTSDADLLRIKTEAAKGSDAALAAKDQRSRAKISASTDIPAGTVVRIPGETVDLGKRVIGPGRGDGWMLLGWKDPETGDTFGTYHESQVTVPKG